MKTSKDPKHKLTVGHVIVTTEEEWSSIQEFLSEHSTIVYVRKVPYPHKLRISEDFSEVNKNVSEESYCTD